MDRLLTRCDVVVMDLRSFGAENQGSAHELELLSSRGALSRTVLLVDHRTDLVLLNSILGSGDHGGATLLEAKNGDLDEALSALAAASAMTPTAPRK